MNAPEMIFVNFWLLNKNKKKYKKVKLSYERLRPQMQQTKSPKPKIYASSNALQISRIGICKWIWSYGDVQFTP